MSYNARLRGNDLIRNHEGARAWMQTPEFELYSAVVCTMSTDDKFYEGGDERINRIASLIRMVPAEFTAQLAVYARTEMHLRSIPMLLLVELSECHSGDNLVSRAAELAIQRADDITELLACYQWRRRSKDLKRLSNQLRKGIAHAFNKFDEYQFAKYDGKGRGVTLRDALFIAHPRAKDAAQQLLFDKIASGGLEVPYTWETQLSEAGKMECLSDEERLQQKAETWTSLIQSRRMGYMALLRNLRNMLQAGVSDETMQIVYDYLSDENAVKSSRLLPFRFFAAYLMMTGNVETSDSCCVCPDMDLIRRIRARRRRLRDELRRQRRHGRLLLVRKVCRRRPHLRSSQLLAALNEVGLQNLHASLHPWHESRMRHKLAGKKVSNHLAKYIARLAGRIKMLGYDIQQLYTSCGTANLFFAPKATLDCLEKAVKHSAGSIPSFDESTRVCIACDTSGSMERCVSQHSIMNCYDIGLFFGAMMKYRIPGAVVGMFADIWKTIDMPGDSIMANVVEMRWRMGEVGYSTNGHKVIEWLQNEGKVMDKVMVFTDCQLWNSEAEGRHLGDERFADAWRKYKSTIAPDAKLYLFDLAGYGQNPLDVDREEDVYMIAGWSDKIFDMLAALENGESAIGKIRRIAL